MGKKSAYPLFLVNSGLPSKELLVSSLLHPSHVVWYDHQRDTFDSVTRQLLESPSYFSEIVWVTHGNYNKQFKFFEQQDTWSVVENISMHRLVHVILFFVVVVLYINTKGECNGVG